MPAFAVIVPASESAGAIQEALRSVTTSRPVADGRTGTVRETSCANISAADFAFDSANAVDGAIGTVVALHLAVSGGATIGGVAAAIVATTEIAKSTCARCGSTTQAAATVRHRKAILGTVGVVLAYFRTAEAVAAGTRGAGSVCVWRHGIDFGVAEGRTGVNVPSVVVTGGVGQFDGLSVEADTASAAKDGDRQDRRRPQAAISSRQSQEMRN